MALGDLIARLRLDSKQFDTNIRKSTAEIRSIQKEGKQLNASLGQIGKVFKSIAPAIGIATSAFEIFRRTIRANEYVYDNFKSNIEASKAVIDSFYLSLANGSFDTLVNGMNDVVKSAKELYSALDALETFRVFKITDSSDIERQIEEALTIVRKADKKDENGLPLVTEEQVAEAKRLLGELDTEYRGLIDKELRYSINANDKRIQAAAKKIGLNNKAQIDDLRHVWDDWDLYEEWSGWLDKNESRFKNLANKGILSLDTSDKEFKRIYEYRRKIVGTVESETWKSYKDEKVRMNIIGREVERMSQRITRAEIRTTSAVKETNNTNKETNKELERRNETITSILHKMEEINAIQDNMSRDEVFHFNIDVDSNVDSRVPEIKRELKRKLKDFGIELDVDIDKTEIEELKPIIARLNKEHITKQVDLKTHLNLNIDFTKPIDQVREDVKQRLSELDITPKIDIDTTPLEEIEDYVAEIEQTEIKIDVKTAIETKPRIDVDLNKPVAEVREKLKSLLSKFNITPKIDIDTAPLEDIEKYINELNSEEVVVDVKTAIETKPKVKADVDKPVEDIRKKVKGLLSDLKIEPEIDIDTAPIDKIIEYVNKLREQHIEIDVDTIIKQQPEIDINTDEIHDKIEDSLASVKIEFDPDKTSLENIRNYFEKLKINPEVDEKTFDVAVNRFKENFKQQLGKLGITPDIDIDTASIEEIGAYINELNNERIDLDIDNMTEAQLKRLVEELDMLHKMLIETSDKYYIDLSSNVVTAINKFKYLGETIDIQPVEVIVEPILDEEGMKEEEKELNALLGKTNDIVKEAVANGATFAEVLSAIDFGKQMQQLEDMTTIVGGLGDAFSTIGDAFDNNGGAFLSWAGKQMTVISELISKYIALSVAKASGEAIFPQNIVAISSTLAAIIAAIASIPKFQYGGKVGGPAAGYDNTLALLQPGERVLSQKQNDKFERLLENGSFGGNVVFTIHGRDLQGTLDNNNNYNTSINKR